MSSTHESKNFFLQGPAGKLEAVLWTPPAAAPGMAALVCHPHPVSGGTMHNKVVFQAAKALESLGIAVLRFNFRGAGLSDGIHDQGRGEIDDARAALDFLAAEFPGTPLLVAGFSFGAWVGLRAGCADLRVTELLGLGLPVGDLVGDRGFSYLDSCGKSKLFIAGEFDQYGPPEKLHALVERFSSEIKAQISVEIVRGADHFFTGHHVEVDGAIANWLIDRHPGLAARRPD